MQPYVIRQGDYVAKLAYSLGFDADTVWNDDKNTDLRGQRPDPNTLLPGDVLYVPDTPTEPQFVDAGTTNTFVASAPTVPVTIKFAEARFASQACEVYELEQLTGLSTNGDGILSFSAPVTLDVVTVLFTGLNFACSCALGCLDPIETLSGVFQRLQNLGYIEQALAFDATNTGIVRGALRALKAAAGSDTASDSASSASVDGSQSGPEQSDNLGGDGAAADGSSSQDAGPPDQAVPNDGLADDGRLDDQTRELLVGAHGC
jgi:hypothetical protein